jgi:uncharacterized hydrophobic protein (TIGR00271 family)
MVHVRLVVPHELTDQVLELLCQSPAVFSVAHFPDAAHKPEGDLVMADLAREDASVIISDLRELDLHKKGTIAIEAIDSAISDAADAAEKHAKGMQSDAVIWEQVESRTSEETELSASFLAFMIIAMLLVAVAVIEDSPVLLIGAMVVGPEFGPLAGICVAIVQRRREMAKKSVEALAVGFPVAIVITYVATVVWRAVGIAPETIQNESQVLLSFISHPDWFSVIIAFLAGMAGIISLTAAKSGALIGVLISVTTIPAAGNMAVAAAYQDWDEAWGATQQLAINLVSIIAAGVLCLYVQRRLYIRRRKRHLSDPERQAAGLPSDRTAHGSVVLSGREIERLQKSKRRP